MGSECKEKRLPSGSLLQTVKKPLGCVEGPLPFD